MIQTTRFPLFKRVALCGAVFSMLMAGAAVQAANLKMQGVWKLATPQSSLKPASGEPIPFTADGKAQYESNKADAAKGDYEFDMTQSRCSSPGAPRIMLTPKRFRIFVEPDILLMSFEWNRLFRQIDMRGKPTPDPEFGTMMGSASGKWDGDVLVVETKGLAPQKLIDDRITASEDLTLVERIRLKDSNTLEDRITITDPQTFTKPWEAVLTYKRQKDEVFPEDVCLDRKAAGESPLPR